MILSGRGQEFLSPRRGFGKRPLLCLLAFGAVFGGDVPVDDRFAESAALAAALAERLELTREACPPEVTGLLGSDRAALCGTPGVDHGAWRNRLRAVVEDLQSEEVPLLLVLDWHRHLGPFRRIAFWVRAASLEVLWNRATGGVALVYSRDYGRCGPEIPFAPRAGDDEFTIPLFLTPEGYPDEAARKKMDGSVALAVTLDGGSAPSVLCIHHATPAGYGFELPAIEAARTLSAGLESDRSRVVNAVVRFSKADERPKGTRIKYH